MKSIVRVLAFLTIIPLLGGCFWSAKKESKLVIINVLDPDYYQDCHITGSINIPFEQFEDAIRSMNKQDNYVTYCSNYTCTAAPFAAGMMQDQGFEHVSVLPGGIVDWYQKGLPVQGLAQKEYLKDENEPLDGHADKSIAIITTERLHELMIAAKLI